MIHVKRLKPPAELIEIHRAEVEQLRALFAVPESERAQVRPFIEMRPRIRETVRAALLATFNGRCAFCERPASTVEHFRPKWRATRLDRSIDPDYYAWLASDWNNLYLCCRECNVRKANLFPIAGPKAKPFTFGDELRDEIPMLLDPCFDDPSDHLRFAMDGTIAPLSDRGEATIKVFALDDPALTIARKKEADLTLQFCAFWLSEAKGQYTAEALMHDAETYFSAHPSFLAVVRAAVKEFVQEHSGLLAVPAAPQAASPPSAPPPTDGQASDLTSLPNVVWLETIEIRNFKTISNLDLSFPGPAEIDGEVRQPWLTILGENSVGKSTLLQAVSLALMPQDQLDRCGRADAWLSKRHDADEGYVKLTFSNNETRTLAFAKKTKTFTSTGALPPIPVLAYGSTRLLPGKRARKPDAPALVSVANLFDHTHPLVKAEAYLCDSQVIDADRFKLLATNLRDLLPAIGDADISRTKTELKSRMHGRPISLDELSDGYKSVLALAMDIMYHLTNSSFDMESAQGLVMIDELEVHLHPRWKIQIVGQLRKLFPRVRFITTTHDPLCVHGLQKGELHVMARHPVDHAFLIEQIDVPAGTRADDVLTGPWFGLASTIDAETLELMSEHSNLLQRHHRTDAQSKRKDELEEILRARMRNFGDTRAQRAAMAVAAVLDHGAQPHADQLVRHRLKQLLDDASDPAKESGHA